MSNEMETKPTHTETWGYYQNHRDGKESADLGLDWYEAGRLGKYDLNDNESLNSFHALVNSYTNLLRESQERPFKMIIEPAHIKVNPEASDANMFFVMLEPELDETTIKELSDYADKLRVR